MRASRGSFPRNSKHQFDDLELADRTSSLSALATGLAHEINNPLAFVMGNLEVAEEYFSVLAEAAKRIPSSELLSLSKKGGDLEFIQRDGIRLCVESIDGLKRVERLVKTILEFSRVEDSETVETNVPEALNGALELLYPRIRYSMDLELKLQDAPTVRGFPSRLKHAFVNVIENAVDAARERGLLQVSLESNDKWIRVAITDNGHGIPQDLLKDVFHPFFTTRLKGASHFGLGLPIAQRIIEAHGGCLFIGSEEGRGTSARILLPLGVQQKSQQRSGS